MDLRDDPKEIKCSGDIATCEKHGGECMECGERDCPSKDSCHYFHDGCPSCGGAYDESNETPEEKKSIDDLTARVQEQIVQHKVKFS